MCPSKCDHLAAPHGVCRAHGSALVAGPKGITCGCPQPAPERSALDDTLDAVREEYARAKAKHGEMTMDGAMTGTAHDDVLRLAALMEEVGEAAAEMTYDKANDERLYVELIQVANVAVTWATMLAVRDQP